MLRTLARSAPVPACLGTGAVMLRGSLGDNCASEALCEVSLMRVALAVIDVEEREASKCDLKKLLASCE